MTKPKLAIVDADTILYTAALKATESRSFFGETPEPSLETAIRRLAGYLRHLSSGALAAYNLRFYLSDNTSNFRNTHYPPYKQGRGERPDLLEQLRGWLMDHHDAKWAPGLEADDLVCIHATKESVVIVGCDKDFNQIPNTPRYNQQRDEWVGAWTEQQAIFDLHRQVLMGDRIDGYPGLNKVGPKKAEKYLEDIPFVDPNQYEAALWDRVVEAYEERGETREYAIQMMRCARLLRHGDYNFRTGEILIWHPPS